MVGHKLEMKKCKWMSERRGVERIGLIGKKWMGSVQWRERMILRNIGDFSGHTIEIFDTQVVPLGCKLFNLLPSWTMHKTFHSKFGTLFLPFFCQLFCQVPCGSLMHRVRRNPFPGNYYFCLKVVASKYCLLFLPLQMASACFQQCLFPVQLPNSISILFSHTPLWCLTQSERTIH